MNDLSLIVHTYDGCMLNISTEEGANSLLNTAKPNVGRYFRWLLDESETNPEKRINAYTIMSICAERASKDVFETKITKEDVRFLVTHLVELLEKLASNEQWIRTGQIGEDYTCSVSIIPAYLRRNDFAVACHAQSLFSKYATFLRAWKGRFSLSTASEVLSVLYNYSAYMQGYRGVADMRDAGLLAQGLRAFAVPGISSEVPHFVPYFKLLAQEEHFVATTFASGTDTGDMFEIVLGAKESKPDPMALELLRLLARSRNRNKYGRKLLCGLCSKLELEMASGSKLLTCSKCKSVRYCSKECQRKDWKQHKKTCGKEAKPLEDSEVLASVVNSFLLNQSAWIVRGVVSAMADSGKSKRDFVVEVDFYQHDATYRPQNKFKIKELRRLKRGDGLPDWFPAEGNSREDLLKHYQKVLKEGIAALTEPKLLFSIRQPSGRLNFIATELMHPQTLESIVSDRCLNAFAERDVETLKTLVDMPFMTTVLTYLEMPKEVQLRMPCPWID